MKFIFLNAPPRAGKDYFAEYATSKHQGITPVKFAAPLYEGIKTIFGLGDDLWEYLYEHHKDEPLQELRGMSPRESMIWLSEDVMKPKFGKDFFGHSLANHINALLNECMIDDDEVLVASDSGFFEEHVPILNLIGADNCHHIQISREGCTFDGDSRSYWTPDDPRVTQHQLYNDGTDDYLREIDALFRQIATVK